MEEVHIVQLYAEPKPDSDLFTSVGGAYINVFATASTEEAAVELACREMAQTDWEIRQIEEVVLVTRADYSRGEDGANYFEQALIDGVVIVIHTFSPEKDDEGTVH